MIGKVNEAQKCTGQRIAMQGEVQMRVSGAKGKEDNDNYIYFISIKFSPCIYDSTSAMLQSFLLPLHKKYVVNVCICRMKANIYTRSISSIA
jgi:hypothetical protein